MLTQQKSHSVSFLCESKVDGVCWYAGKKTTYGKSASEPIYTTFNRCGKPNNLDIISLRVLGPINLIHFFFQFFLLFLSSEK